MLLRLFALVGMAAAVFVLLNAGQPIVEQNRKVRDWPWVEVTVSAKVIDIAPATTVPSALTTTRSTAPTTAPTSHAVTRAAGISSGEKVILVGNRYPVGDTVQQVWRPHRLNEHFDGREYLEPALSTSGFASYQTRGYYDPAKPQDVFIPSAFGLGTYLPIFAAAPLLGLSFGALVMNKRARTSARMSRVSAGGEKGWHRLSPASISPRDRAAGAWGAAVVCNAVVGFALYDFFAATPRMHSHVGNVLAWLCVVPGAVILVVAAYLSRRARRHAEPRAWVNEMPVKPGERFAVKCEVPVNPAMPDAEASVVVTVACLSRGEVIWEEGAERSIAGRGKQDGRATFEQRFTIPAEVVSRIDAGERAAIIDAQVRIDRRVFSLPLMTTVAK